MTEQTTVTLIPWERWTFSPQLDITTYELAIIMAGGYGWTPGPEWQWGALVEKCGEAVKRHFQRVA
jgi:hypothetical protein